MHARNRGRTSWLGEFTPQLTDDLDADVLHAMLFEDFLTDLVGSFTDAASHFRVEGFARGDGLSDRLYVGHHVGGNAVSLRTSHVVIIRDRVTQVQIDRSRVSSLECVR